MSIHWMQAIGSRRVDLVHPTPDMIDFEVMARVLARIPRFTGHTEGGVLSTAQHSVEGARAIRRDTGSDYYAGVFLLHDGHEEIIGDIATPVANAVAFYAVLESRDIHAEDLVRRAFKALKNQLDSAIYPAGGFTWPLPDDAHRIVREYDLRMLRTERDARLGVPPEPWITACEEAEPIVGADLTPWPEAQAYREFMEECAELLPRFRLGNR